MPETVILLIIALFFFGSAYLKNSIEKKNYKSMLGYWEKEFKEIERKQKELNDAA